MKKLFFHTVLLNFFFVSSCNLAPKYFRPKANINENWSQNIIDSKACPSLSEPCDNQEKLISWEEFFDDENLKQIIKIGLENNRDLKIAALNIQASKEFYNIQKSDLMPRIDGEASFRRQKITKNSTNFGFSGRAIIQNQYFVGANLSYEIDFLGKIRNLKTSALKEFLAKKEARQALKTSLISQISTIYLNLSYLKSKLENSQKIVLVNEKIYNLKKKSFENGLISKSELLDSSSDFYDSKSGLDLIVLDYEQNLNQLLYLINEKDEKNIVITNLDEIKFTKNLPENLSSDILLTRPDILEKEFELMKENANIGAARAAFFPSVGLTSRYGYASARFSRLFNSGSKGSWNFAPQLTLPIFNFGENLANFKLAKVEQKIAAEEYLKTIEAAFKEVKDEFSARKNLENQFKSLNEKSKNKEDLYKISLQRLNSGIDNYYIKGEKEIAFYETKIERDQALRDFLGSKVDFYKAIGGGV